MSYQSKVDMSDNKFLLIAKESITAELAHTSGERLGVRASMLRESLLDSQSILHCQ